MDNKTKAPDRKHNRLKNYDYSSTGAYFITICTKDRQNILSEIIKSIPTASHDTPPCQTVGTDVPGGPLNDANINFTASHDTPPCQTVGTDVPGGPLNDANTNFTASHDTPSCQTVGTDVPGGPLNDANINFTASHDTPPCQTVGTDVPGGPLNDANINFTATKAPLWIDDLPPVYTKLTAQGEIVEKILLQLDEFYHDINVDEYVIMPDHIHILFSIPKNGPPRTSVPTAQTTPLSKFISTFKRFTNKEIGYNIWQYRSYDHIIRDRHDYEAKRKYIYENPIKRYYKDLENKEKNTEI
ncbi:MAG: hypothetical protein E7611_03440 [Ruminococcaceae bacterium]|nr:hypothetical protein [Oscillospiraceae bacterium]